MANIIHCRIDDRLIHGQVATNWLPHTKANLCLIASDEVADNDTQKTLLSMALPRGVSLRCFSIEQAIAIIDKAGPTQNIFVLLPSVSDASRLINGGFPITAINLGNISSRKGTEQLFRTVHINDTERCLLQEIVDKGINISYSLLPGDQPATLKGKL